jgi:hypothetical protein
MLAPCLSIVTKTEHDHVCARCDIGGVDDSADSRRNAAADVAIFVEWCVFADLGDGDFRQQVEFEKVEQPI